MSILIEFTKRIKNLYLDLINTGERPILEKKFEDIISDHQFAYKFAVNYVKNKTVMDFGCGGGYGSEFLSRFTLKNVIGYDIDKNTIATTDHFFNNKNLSFTSNPDDLQKYDVITMFQVIEHFTNIYLSEILSSISRTYLQKDGLFICSTPNKLITSPGLKKPVMVFHNFEFTPTTLEKTLKKYFKYIKLFGQLDITTNQSKLEKTYSIRKKITRGLSQIEIVRMISRHLPIKFKYLLMGNLVKDKHTYKLVSKKNEVKNSFTLIALCHN
jgi:2-polyprenyl-3-methyl-5-hydroxy-6-metoxy-1,4-benzoquinol methylase